MSINAIRSLALSITLLTSSCVAPDPLYLQNAGRITDANYPANKVVGTWATMFVASIQTTALEREAKVFYKLSAGGGGQVRQVDSNRVTGTKMVLEAPLHWSYQGRNYWRVFLPSSDQYKVTGTTGHWDVGARPAVTVSVRYYEGNLYVTPGGGVWVPATVDSVSAMANRLRSRPPFLRIETPP